MERDSDLVYFNCVCWDSTRYPVIIQILNYLDKGEERDSTRVDTRAIPYTPTYNYLFDSDIEAAN